MKKIILIVIISVSFLSAEACEICGCGVGNYYIGLLPRFNHRFFGLRYQFNSYRTRLTDDPTQFSNDFYQTVEFWSGFNIGKRVQLLAFVPYNFNHQSSDEGVSNLNGLGDITVVMNYKLLDKSADKSVSHQLWIGGGFKLPTGKFEIEPSDPDVASAANNQRGSGSTDFLLNTQYDIRIDKWGINTNASYKFNSVNKDDYKFGNKFAGSSFVYYTAVAKNTVISPNLGLLYENTQPSELDKSEVALTGGSLLLGSMGMEISFKRMAVGFNAQLPLAQNFAEGQTVSKIKGMAHVTFAL